MKLFLLLIPIFTTFFGFLIYKYQDRKLEIFKLDLVQFTYLFIVTPTFYVWLKSFLFYLLRNELDLRLSVTDLFVVDTIFSVLAFIIMAAIAIHSLTKTFWLKRNDDPKFDIYHLSEYFHLWWTHIVIWGGGMLLATFVSISNVLVPFQISTTNKFQFYTFLLFGLISGLFTFFTIWLSDAKQGNYMRLMKLVLAFFTVLHILIYFILDPLFNMTNIAYWFVFANLISAIICASLVEKNEHKSKVQQIRDFFAHKDWGNNKGVILFEKKRNSN